MPFYKFEKILFKSVQTKIYNLLSHVWLKWSLAKRIFWLNCQCLYKPFEKLLFKSVVISLNKNWPKFWIFLLIIFPVLGGNKKCWMLEQILSDLKWPLPFYLFLSLALISRIWRPRCVLMLCFWCLCCELVLCVDAVCLRCV